MYNGSGGNRGGYTRIGGYPVKPLYLAIAIAIAVAIVLFLVLRFLNTGLVMHFGAYAGFLLLIANVRELVGSSYGQRGSTALLNVMVGGALLCAWLSQLLGALFWVPALLLVGIATPLIFGRGQVYTAYLDTAKNVAGSLRRTLTR